ncbi:MAG: hypothetical protein EXR75_14450 [Myxococcales bacterium]|nr:hypothetical protein [Myxococcales bacterium]
MSSRGRCACSKTVSAAILHIMTAACGSVSAPSLSDATSNASGAGGAGGSFSTSGAGAGAPDASGGGAPFEGKYLMAFHACDKAQSVCDFTQHSVYVARSDDGASWSVLPGWTPFKGSVPDLVRRGNTLYIYTPGKLVRYHTDTGVLDAPVLVDVAGSTGFVDPSPLLDKDGRIVLAFLHCVDAANGGKPSMCFTPQKNYDHVIGIATEKDGSDGASFTLATNTGLALYALPGSASGTDPDLFTDGVYSYLYVSFGSNIGVWRASELTGSYQRLKISGGDFLSNVAGGVPAGHVEGGQFWTFAHTSKDGTPVIRRAIHTGFDKLLQDGDWQTVLSGPSLGMSQTTLVESPGFAVNEP